MRATGSRIDERPQAMPAGWTGWEGVGFCAVQSRRKTPLLNPPFAYGERREQKHHTIDSDFSFCSFSRFSR